MPSEKRLRILHVFRAPLGGLFRHVLDLARAQAARGHDVGIVCDAGTGGERADRALEALRPGLTLGLTRVPMRRNPHPRDLTALMALRRVYGEQRANVLHGHGSKGGAYARLVTDCSLDGRTIRAYTPHGGSFNYKPGTSIHKVYMGAERLLARRTDLFLFESGYVADRFGASVGETDALVRVVHNGIGEAEFAPLTRVNDPFDLLYVGELRPAKGVETLLDALAALRRDGLRLTLLVVGSGPSEGNLQRRAKQLGIWDSVAFVPPQPIRDALGRARIMVIPSRAESLPYVILEAAAAAQPLVATRVGGIPEIFGPYADDLIPPDDTAVLADAIRRKLEETDRERWTTARSLSEHVRCRFSLETMIDRVLEGYRDAFRTRGIAA